MKQYTTYSDAASLKIGNDMFRVNFENGLGDGSTEVIICENKEKLVPSNALFENMMWGKDINIYEYDCGGKDGEAIVATISGRYGVYSLGGTVYLEKWGD